MVDAVFNACVVFLLTLARMLGMTYEAVNVWIFCVIEPIVFFALVGFAFCQAREIQRLRVLNDKKDAFANNGCGVKPFVIRKSTPHLSICGDS